MAGHAAGTERTSKTWQNPGAAPGFLFSILSSVLARPHYPLTMPRCWVVCVSLVPNAACGQAQESVAPRSGMPESVNAILGELTGLCREVGGTPHAENGVRRADLNADGHDDYILFARWIHCENAISVYGDRQKSLAVFAADGHGDASAACSDSVFDAELETVNGVTQLWLTTMGEQCGRPAAPTFAEETFCRRAIIPVSKAKLGYAPVSTVRIIE